MKNKLNSEFLSLIQVVTFRLKRAIPPSSETISTLQTTADEEKKAFPSEMDQIRILAAFRRIISTPKGVSTSECWKTFGISVLSLF
jgi:hypothetical protein